MTERSANEQIDAWVLAYLDGALGPADFVRLSQAMHGDPAALDRFVELASLDRSLLDTLRHSDEVQTIHHANLEQADPALSFEATLALLGRGSESAQLVHLHPNLRPRHRVMPYLIGAAIAAVLVLAVTLTFVFSGGPNTPSQDPGFSSGPVPTTQNTVATLTAEHNAVWHQQPGEDLRAGDRLTLTQGFAEITTEEGAVVILEAPATVELLDNGNAIRLHAGKLVGICETDSSKGFLVRTPHMDITDLGTRFGVDASQADASEVHVFAGAVHAARSGTVPILLGADQSARASAGTPAIATITHDTERFAAIRDESRLGPPSSTTVLDTDTSGTQWLITTSQHGGSETYLGNRVTCSVDNTGFMRGVVGGNAYGFIQYQASGAGSGQAATATATWRFSNLPAGRYDVATAFAPSGAGSVRYTINGDGVLVDQSALPASDAGPSFSGGIGGYVARDDDIQFTRIGSSVVVPEGGTITVTIDNSNVPLTQRSNMDSVAITLLPEAGPN